MICPQCGAEQEEGRPECRRCGIIFAKLKGAAVRTPPKAERSGTVRTLLFGSGDEENPFYWAGRLLVYVVLFVWGWVFILTPMADDYFARTFLHGVNLAFHEAGHVFFGLFGRFTGVLGGTLGQFLMPLVCLGAFLFRRNPFAASAALWWTAENFMDIAPYVNDARALRIPLLGGNIGSDNPDFHDWHHILRDLGWLPYDHTLAGLSNRLGVLLMVLALVWGGYLLYRQFRAIRRIAPVP